jgi:hypothetical protein
MKLAYIAGVCAILAVPSAAFAMSEAECTAVWTKADVNKDGVLSEAEGRRYFAAAAFLEHCTAGLFDQAKAGTGAPLPGANSFTKAQAEDRVIAAGFTNISALKKDEKGIWRGTATDGGNGVHVAIDYKGNVVAN